MAEQNKEWSLQLNVAGESFFKPGTIDVIADGPHAAIIKDTWREPGKAGEDGKTKADNIVFELEVADGPEKGKKCRKYKSVDQGEPGSVPRKEWKNLLVSVVKDPAALEAGAKTLKADFFRGKTVFIMVQNPPEGTTLPNGKKPFANINFITKDMVTELKATSKSAPRTAAGPKPEANGAAKSFEVSGGGAATPQPESASDPLE